MDIVDGIVELIKSYISMENICMIPFLILLGRQLKKSKRVDDTLIPDLLIFTGIAFALVFGLSSNTPINILQWVILFATSIGQGYFTALVAVGVHQQLKQRKAFKMLSSFSGEEEEESV